LTAAAAAPVEYQKVSLIKVAKFQKRSKICNYNCVSWVSCK